MKLIIGGAYQGKLATAQERYNILPEDCWDCSKGIRYSYKLLYQFENYILQLRNQGINPLDYVEENQAAYTDKIIVLTDISCGIVPMDAETRKWREDVGQIGQWLSTQADEVVRVFCGICTRLK